MANFYNKQYDRVTNGKDLPLVSTGTDSRRAYEWEIFFSIPDIDDEGFPLAAKKVSGAGFRVNKITSDRVNDKTFYAGKIEPDEITILFDNLKDHNILSKLYTAIKEVYDPTTGYFNPVDEYKGYLKVIQLNEERQPVSETRYTGAFITSWKPSDYDYAQNEFATIECTFSVDFVVQDQGLFGPGF